MNFEAIENLKAGMADRVAEHFDPLLKIRATFMLCEIIESENAPEEIKQRAHFILKWSNDIFATGNIACNLNVILQNQNLALLAENENLKAEVKKLKAEQEWNTGT